MGMTTTIAITTTTAVRSRRCSIVIMIVVVVILFFFLLLLLVHFIFQSIRFFTFYSYSSHCCDDVFTYITLSLSFVVRKYRGRLLVYRYHLPQFFLCCRFFWFERFLVYPSPKKRERHFIGRERIFHSRIIAVLPTPYIFIKATRTESHITYSEYGITYSDIAYKV